MFGRRFSTMFVFLTCFAWPPVTGLWFFSCRHGNGKGDVGDSCSFFCQCRPPNTCEAGVQRCVPPGQLSDPCHVTRPCGKGLSCHPGVQRCYHVPRSLHEPCVAGYECGSGLTCHPGIQVCYHSLRQYYEPCVAGFPCGPGLSCQPGLQRCLHFPRRENECCSLGFECGAGLECTLCGKPYLTCQMNKVPNMDEEFYQRPYNKVAFLVTHNSFSNSVKYALWVRNQRVSVTQQLNDGVRGLMLDIYPGWGSAEVRLCHGNCFWGGSSNLLDTLIQIRTFLEDNPRDVITIIFEDYLRNPTILKRVFDQARVSRHVLRSHHWGSRYKDWPTLIDMRRLGRLVVFNNVGLNAFPYTTYNMWWDVRENRYGREGQDTKTCADRGESVYNTDYNTNWSLVLVNWFGTLTNPFNPCLNSLNKLKEKLSTCYKAFGERANFLAVDFYRAGAKGGAFKAIEWLNEQWKEQFEREKKVKTWGFDIMKAMKASQEYYDHVTNKQTTDTSVTSNHVTNTTDGNANITSGVKIDWINHVTNTTHHVTNTTHHVTNTTHHVTNMSHHVTNTTNVAIETNHNKTDHVVNRTRELENMTYLPANGTGHVMNMTEYQTSVANYVTNTTDHELDTTEHVTNMTNHVTNRTDHVKNTTNHLASIADHVTNMTNHVTNRTDHVSNTSNKTWMYNYNNSTLNPSENFTNIYFESPANTTNDNITFKDSNSSNRGIALSSALTNDGWDINDESNTLDLASQARTTSSQSRENGDALAPNKGIEYSINSRLPVEIGNYTLGNTAANNGDALAANMGIENSLNSRSSLPMVIGNYTLGNTGANNGDALAANMGIENSLNSRSSLPMMIGNYTLENTGRGLPRGGDTLRNDYIEKTNNELQDYEPVGEFNIQDEQNLRNFIVNEDNTRPAYRSAPSVQYTTGYHGNDVNNLAASVYNMYGDSNGRSRRVWKVPVDNVQDGTQSLDEYIDDI